MATYDLLSDDEKRSIISGRIRSLEYNLFSTETEITEETAVTVNPDGPRITELSTRAAVLIEKIDALKVELAKYAAPAN